MNQIDSKYIPDLTNLNAATIQERHFKIHFPEFHAFLIGNYPDDLKWSERLYWYMHKLTKHPVCPVCGKRVVYQDIRQGYRQHCSKKCLGQSDDIKQAREKTCLEHYGVTNPMHSRECKERMAKNNIKKFGVVNPFQAQECKEKSKRTCLEKYGVEHHLQSAQILEKQHQTNLERYGVKYSSQSQPYKEKRKISHDHMVEKMKDTFSKRLVEAKPEIIAVNKQDLTISCQHPECNKCSEKTFHIDRILYHNRKSSGIEICPVLCPHDQPFQNTCLERFIRDILDKYGIQWERTRKILKGKEIDIYIPSKKLGIECNGVYWHSDKYKTKDCHNVKWIACKQQGIQLLTIWEDQIRNQPQIVESLILSKLGIYQIKIGARQCIIKEVDQNSASNFLRANHLQGECSSKISLGLYYKDELVSLMAFGRRVNNSKSENEWELIRFCNALYTQVEGGASRLFAYFVKSYQPDSIISYSSNDISWGNLYRTLGFNKISETKYSYWYIDLQYQRHHRSSFCKKNLVKRGADPNLTEFQIMNQLGYLRIYDSGQTKWIWNKE